MLNVASSVFLYILLIALYIWWYSDRNKHQRTLYFCVQEENVTCRYKLLQVLPSYLIFLYWGKTCWSWSLPFLDFHCWSRLFNKEIRNSFKKNIKFKYLIDIYQNPVHLLKGTKLVNQQLLKILGSESFARWLVSLALAHDDRKNTSLSSSANGP